MGLSASQTRFLALTAKKSNLEYQSQIINTRRLQLADRAAAASKAYNDGMANRIIRVANTTVGTNGITTKEWETLNFENLLQRGYQLIGANGAELTPAPYIEVEVEEELTDSIIKSLGYTSDGNYVTKMFSANQYNSFEKRTDYSAITNEDGTTSYKRTVTADDYANLVNKEGFVAVKDDTGAITGYEKIISANIYNTAIFKEDFGENPTPEVDGSYKLNLTKEDFAKKNGYELSEAGKYTRKITKTIPNPDYAGIDLQTLLVSGQAQIVTGAFYNFLVEHGYGSGAYALDGEIVSYAQLVDSWESNGLTCDIDTIVDWRADTSSMFKQSAYTEDDAQAAADYEAITSEIQAQDKRLELEIKRIETEHKAIETEMESVKKVITKNIEDSYKSFA